MSSAKAHISFYKTIAIMLLLAFSLSPCSVKRDLLDIFDLQYAGTLNKVKTTTASNTTCDSAFQNSSAASAFKADVKLKKTDFYFNLYLKNPVEKGSFLKYTKKTTGNSPPKYILFKRLKLDLI